MSRSLKTEALSMYSLRLSMYVMLMSRSLKKMELRDYSTAVQHAYYCKKYPEHETYYYCDSVCISCLSGFSVLDKLQKAKVY